ncbi:MAG: hypothetical protein F6K40_02110 [Okeania sp. SIO3I5]|uniref:acyl-CoA dehydrogenase family protein n=1 Tax=Okeania sp. SIO3I5 TaxID=2607805 RepID=UPI0013B8398B|nr:acyl-CoA dehydrogenase family protein [Okeania sp. SIO3I5]NEQ35168.1 hypothetical protein [Okeania sp. SIO3I5]
MADFLLKSSDKTSFLGNLLAGTVRGDLVFPFPEQEKDDEIIGSEITAKLEALLKDKVDRTQIDTTQSLPDGLFDELRAQGFMNLRDPVDYNGLGLSNFNTFRLIKKAAEYSTTVALAMAVQTSIGIGGYLKYIPKGYLRNFVLKHTRKRSISGNADAEAEGASHPKRFTTATLTEDGTAYLLNGKKVYISNASIADVLVVSARVYEQDREITRLFFVETSSSGFEVTSEHEFMGLKGFPSVEIQFNNVRVPKEQVLLEPPLEGLILSSHLALMLGRIYMQVAPSVAIGELCTKWMRDYLKRRSSIDLPLEKYEALQNIVALSLAEVFAMESVAEWSVLIEDRRNDLEPKLEQVVARNICANTCWRILDRTMSVMATEGYETAQSKKARGVSAVPLECCLRDARALRTQCGADFLLDCLFAQMIIFPIFYKKNNDLNVNPVSEGQDTILDNLSTRNQRHWHFLVEENVSLANICQNLVKKYPNPRYLYPKEEMMILTTQMVSELMTISLVLSKAASLEATLQPNPQDLADIYCTAARYRISELKNKLLAEEHPNYQGVFQDWLNMD